MTHPSPSAFPDLPASPARTDHPADLSSLSRMLAATARAGHEADLQSPPQFQAAVDELLAAGVALAAPTAGASLTHMRVDSGSARTLAATPGVAATVDALQYRSGQGPCLDAAAAGPVGRPVVTDELGTDDRWPTLAAAAHRTVPEARAVFSCPLPLLGTDRVSLNLYADQDGHWSEPNKADLAGLAGHIVGSGLANLFIRRRSANLEIALESNRLIGAAVGVLITRHQWTYDRALSELVSTSQALHRKVRDLAEEVVLTGALANAANAQRVRAVTRRPPGR